MTDTTGKATARPWVQKEVGDHGDIQIWVEPSEGNEFVRLDEGEVVSLNTFNPTETDRANAALIVDAVNNHEALQERVRVLTNALAFAAAVIKSGEAWTVTCDELIGAALAHDKVQP